MTMTVPSASDSGMLRRGSFTSPAVKVMLFQASAENSEPVCDDADRDEQAERGDRRQPGHDVDVAARRPEVAEVVGDRRRVPAEQQAERGSARRSAPVFAVVKTFWMILP